MRIILAVMAAASAIALPASGEMGRWSGEGAFSAGLNTGNTQTSDLGISVQMERESQIWRNRFELTADYGTTEGAETKNRLYFDAGADRILNDDLFAFGRLSHEINEFSAFESRTFAGSGIGWLVFDEESPANWSIEGGPGIRVDRLRETLSETPLEIVPAQTQETVSLIAASKFGYTFNDAVKFGNDTNMIYADTSTQVGNKSTLTALLTKSLSARVSFEVRHDSDPKTGFEETDTATRMSIVYAFGG
ncbi:DUF481 domain-containing protein [Hyphomonas sp. WL0036]|uniref:DUF481 domain-containing protein n=1 Tax=Hyphomonas sediminis TaxID=2866160 RepID=UPI001C7EE032|nr:DUF481 domain-containing protein [Hyphomonas sediminis]MBY9068515.1 DUF481 domain-containing protein [Hyphomonas sediminis]